MLGFYVDSACEKFVIVDENRLILGGDNIQIVEFDGSVYGRIVFSQDFLLAAVGTWEGGVIILSIESL